VRYRTIPPAVAVTAILTALVLGHGAIQAAEHHEIGGAADWSLSVRYDAAELVRDQSTIFTQPGERP
jgi:hypothetical protein